MILSWDKTFWLIALLAGVLFFAGLGAYPLTDRDEGEYASTAASMRQSGDYIIPTLNGRNYIEKPILIFWLVAGSQSVLGANEFATRLPSTAAAMALLIAFGLLLKRTTGRPDLAAIAVGLLAFCPLFTLVARACMTDTILTLFTTVSLLAFFIATETPPGRDRLWYCLSWACLSLGFLTKGPVAVAVILPAACAYALLQRCFIPTLLRSSLPLGAVIFLLINLPWFVMAFQRLGWEFWNGFFMSQNAKRFSSALLGHGGGPFYYIPVFLLGAFPCSAAGAPGLWLAFKGNPPELRKNDILRRLAFFSAISLLVVFIVFSAAATKLPHYILPAFPFLSVLAACFMLRICEEGGEGRHAGLLRFFWTLLCALCGGVAAAALAAPMVVTKFWGSIERLIRFDSSEYALTAAPPQLGALPVMLALCVGVMPFAVLWIKRGYGGKGAALAMCGGGMFACAIGIVCGVTALMPMHKPALAMVEDVKGKLGGGVEVVTYGLWKPTLFFYMGRDMKRFRYSEDDDFEDLKDLLASDKPVFVLTRAAAWKKLSTMSSARQLKRYDGYLLCGNPATASKWGSGAGN